MLTFINLWNVDPRQQEIDLSRIDRFAYIQEILDKFVVFLNRPTFNGSLHIILVIEKPC
jgi:hypothetical protein